MDEHDFIYFRDDHIEVDLYPPQTVNMKFTYNFYNSFQPINEDYYRRYGNEFSYIRIFYNYVKWKLIKE